MRTRSGPFTLDHERRQLMRDGRTLPIGQREYMLFEALAEASGQAVSKDMLMERAWPEQIVEESNLSVQISALRRALGNDGDSFIITVPRVGYRLVAQAAAPELLRGPPLPAVSSRMGWPTISSLPCHASRPLPFSPVALALP